MSYGQLQAHLREEPKSLTHELSVLLDKQTNMGPIRGCTITEVFLPIGPKDKTWYSVVLEPCFWDEGTPRVILDKARMCEALDG